MQTANFNSVWKQHKSLIQAIVELFHPFVEVAVHDLEKGEIVEIYHNISQRSVGDASPVHELNVETKDFPDYFAPYYKQNWNGKQLKCTSITMRDEDGTPVGLICINVDTSSFQQGYQLLEEFLKIKSKAENPVEIHGSQFEDQANEMIQSYLKKHSLSANHLKRDQKKQLVKHLYTKGLFNFKNAAPFLANRLSTSRATIYNYIKQEDS